MSIQGTMASYELQKSKETFDAYGNSKNEWVKVADVDVAINMSHDTLTNNDISYRVQTPTGLTEYELESDEYRLVGDKTYTIESHYKSGRWTLLNLKVVT